MGISGVQFAIVMLAAFRRNPRQIPVGRETNRKTTEFFSRELCRYWRIMKSEKSCWEKWSAEGIPATVKTGRVKPLD